MKEFVLKNQRLIEIFGKEIITEKDAKILETYSRRIDDETSIEELQEWGEIFSAFEIKTISISNLSTDAKKFNMIQSLLPSSLENLEISDHRNIEHNLDFSKLENLKTLSLVGIVVDGLPPNIGRLELNKSTIKDINLRDYSLKELKVCTGGQADFLQNLPDTLEILELIGESEISRDERTGRYTRSGENQDVTIKSLPTSLKELTLQDVNLHEIDLENCDIRKLTIARCNLIGMNKIPEGVENLTINSNSQNLDLSQLADLENLKQIYFSNFDFGDFDVLQYLPDSLEKIDMHNCNSNKISEFQKQILESEEAIYVENLDSLTPDDMKLLRVKGIIVPLDKMQELDEQLFRGASSTSEN